MNFSKGKGTYWLYAHWYCKSQELCTIFTFCYGFLYCCTGQFYPYPSGLLYWHWQNFVVAPVPVKQPWGMMGNRSYQPIKNYWYNQTKWSTLCVHLMGYITILAVYKITIRCIWFEITCVLLVITTFSDFCGTKPSVVFVGVFFFFFFGEVCLCGKFSHVITFSNDWTPA